MNTTVVAGLIIFILAWFAGWVIALQFVDGLSEALREIWQAGLAITVVAAVVGIVVAAVGADRRWW